MKLGTVTTPVQFTLEQTVKLIEKEIERDPPFSKANEVRRAELDQLRDMIDRRT